RDRDDTMDVIQDLFSSLWLKAADIHLETKLSGHLYLSARNRVFNLIRQQRVRNDFLGSLATFMTEIGTDTMDLIDERAMAEAIDSEIARLPPKMREVFELSRKHH